MHKHSLVSTTPSAERCNPAQTDVTACNHQHVIPPAAHTSTRCFPAATGPETLKQPAASSQPASPRSSPSSSPPSWQPSALRHDHTQCQAGICCRAPTTPTVPQNRDGRRAQALQTSTLAAPAQHVCHGSPSHPVHSPCLSACHSNHLPASFSASTGDHSPEADQKLLWWPLDHVTVQGSRLAVGDSCYVITGHCVVCQVDDERDMVECTRCTRFTHFVCACPKLTCPPQVTLFCQKEVHKASKEGVTNDTRKRWTRGQQTVRNSNQKGVSTRVQISMHCINSTHRQ